jgi:hypothetical protein
LIPYSPKRQADANVDIGLSKKIAGLCLLTAPLVPGFTPACNTPVVAQKWPEARNFSPSRYVSLIIAFVPALFWMTVPVALPAGQRLQEQVLKRGDEK